MTPNYTKIVADARRDYAPNFFTVDVKFECDGSVTFRIALSMQAKDTMIHMHEVKGVALEDAIEEAYRRSEFDNGRAPSLVTIEQVEGRAIASVLLPNSMYRDLNPLNTGN